MTSPFSFFILVMSTLLLADLIPGMFLIPFEVFEYSLNLLLSSFLLRSFNRCFSPLDVLLLSSISLLMSTSSFEIASLDSSVFLLLLLLLLHLLLLACMPSWSLLRSKRLICTVSQFFLVHVVSDMEHDRTCLPVRLRAMLTEFFIICFSHRHVVVFFSIFSSGHSVSITFTVCSPFVSSRLCSIAILFSWQTASLETAIFSFSSMSFQACNTIEPASSFACVRCPGRYSSASLAVSTSILSHNCDEHINKFTEKTCGSRNTRHEKLRNTWLVLGYRPVLAKERLQSCIDFVFVRWRDNDNDNDTLREFHPTPVSGLALQAWVKGSWPHEKESVEADGTGTVGKVCTCTLLMTVCSYIKHNSKKEWVKHRLLLVSIHWIRKSRESLRFCATKVGARKARMTTEEECGKHCSSSVRAMSAISVSLESESVTQNVFRCRFDRVCAVPSRICFSQRNSFSK